MTPKRYAFVVPRFGRGFAGGAEALISSIAQKLHQRGDTVEILTTCAKDNRTWSNELPAGMTKEEGITVRRFPVAERNLDQWIPLQVRLSEGMNLTLDEQLLWMKESVTSEDLFQHIAEAGEDFDAIFFGPYLFGTTFWGSLIHPEKSVLIPCLHDEAYAYLDVVRAMFSSVSGAVFNAQGEMELADDLFGKLRGGEVGMGFEPHDAKYLAGLTPYFSEAFPYLLYLGRKETGKNAQLLIDYFISLKEKENLRDLKLVIMGGGDFTDLHREKARLREDIIDLEHLSEHDKHRVIRHALALCQPSTNESFSIVLMEAWLLSVPVLVHGQCKVTKSHVIDSGGGLFFSDEEDFIAVVKRLASDRTLCSQLAASGFEYVKRRYSWDAVMERFDQAIKNILA
jgi:glycosyltransferase involved in cell wall biosynthesis